MKLFFLAAFLLWSAATVVLTQAPGGGIDVDLSFATAKLGHLVLFAGWTFLLGLTLAIPARAAGSRGRSSGSNKAEEAASSANRAHAGRRLEPAGDRNTAVAESSEPGVSTLLRWARLERVSLWAVWAAAVAFGAALELVQALLPFDREGALVDVGINAIGAAAACLVLYRLRTLRDRRLRDSRS